MDADKLDAEIAARIKAEAVFSDGDTEAAHINADAILCELLIKLGFQKTVDAWSAVDKWYA